MRFSRFVSIDWPGAEGASRPVGPLETMPRELSEQGYHGLWLSDRERAAQEVAPSLSLVAAQLCAAQQEAGDSFEIGVATTLRRFMHPLRLAEEVAMLDIASGGRLRWAARIDGDLDDQSREQLEILRAATRGGATSYSGMHYSFDGVECHPPPREAGGPALHLVTGVTEVADWARERGFEIVAQPPLAPESTGDPDAPAWICPVLLADNDEAARALCGAATGDRRSKDGILVGSPASCLEALERLRDDSGLAHLVVRFEFGKLAQQDARACEARFLAEVLPALS